MSTPNADNADVLPPECPNGCGCRWLDDADRLDCACDGPCCVDEWDTLPDGGFRPGSETLEDSIAQAKADRSAGRWCRMCDRYGDHHTDRHYLYEAQINGSGAGS